MSSTVELPPVNIQEVLPNLFLAGRLALEGVNTLPWVANPLLDASKKWIKEHIDVIIHLRGGHEWVDPDKLFGKVLVREARVANQASQESIAAFLEAIEMLHEDLTKGKRVLLCDKTGTSRSPAVAVGYLFKYHKKSMKEGLDMLVAKHPSTSLSHDMLHVLVDVELHASGTSGVKPHELYDYAPLAMLPLPTKFFTGDDRLPILKGAFSTIPMDWQDATLILPNLWIGNVEAAWDEPWLKRHNITAVVNCAVECESYSDSFRSSANIAAYKELSIIEEKAFPAAKKLEEGADFLHEAFTAGRNALSHCWMGVNRSVSCVLAYLMKYKAIPLLDALHFVKRKRTIAMPNPEMVPHLLALELSLLGFNSFTLAELAANSGYKY